MDDDVWDETFLRSQIDWIRSQTSIDWSPSQNVLRDFLEAFNKKFPKEAIDVNKEVEPFEMKKLAKAVLESDECSGIFDVSPE